MKAALCHLSTRAHPDLPCATEPAVSKTHVPSPVATPGGWALVTARRPLLRTSAPALGAEGVAACFARGQGGLRPVPVLLGGAS